MKSIRNFIGFFFAVVTTLLLSTSVTAQAKSLAELQTELVSPWLVTVDGIERTRTLKIKAVTQKSEGVFALNAIFGLSDAKQTTIEAIVNQTAQGYVLELVTNTGTKIVASQAPDGTFAGTFAPKGGETKGVTIKKISEDGLQAMLDSTTKAPSMIKKPAADVPAACATFSGKWTGTWGYGVGQQWLWVAEVDAKCVVTKVAYVPHARTPINFKAGEIKDGVLQLPCGNNGTCSFKRRGDGLEAWYSNPTGGSNNATFERIQ